MMTFTVSQDTHVEISALPGYDDRLPSKFPDLQLETHNFLR